MTTVPAASVALEFKIFIVVVAVVAQAAEFEESHRKLMSHAGEKASEAAWCAGALVVPNVVVAIKKSVYAVPVSQLAS